jgi:hypothetical protein
MANQTKDIDRTATLRSMAPSSRKAYVKPSVEKVELYRNATLFSGNQSLFGG